MGIRETPDGGYDRGDVEVVVFDGLESAMIGVTVGSDLETPRAVYDIDRAVEEIADRMGVGREEASALLFDNCVFSVEGEGNPLFVSKKRDDTGWAYNLLVGAQNFGFSH